MAGHGVPLVRASLLLGLPTLPRELLCGRKLPLSPVIFWSGMAVLETGLAFSVRARIHLVTNKFSLDELCEEILCARIVPASMTPQAKWLLTHWVVKLFLACPRTIART